jgi:large subunit ribosomal protein L10
MIKAEKKKLVAELVREFAKADNYYFADFAGINTNDVTRLRSELRAENARIKVVKNRLLLRVLSELDVEIPDPAVLLGSTAVLYSLDDALVPARKVSEFARKDVPIRFKGAFLEGRFLTVEEVERLAEIPSHAELLLQLVGLFEGAKSALVSVLQAKPHELVGVLSSFRAQKEVQ